MSRSRDWRNTKAGQLWLSYRLRWKRRELLWRGIRAGRDLAVLVDRTAAMTPDAILCFAVIRNEASLLPAFLDHYRRLGVGHFLIVDNDSDDGSTSLLRDQPDVSLWSAPGSYRDARFGMDWLTALLMRHGNGHWCVTVDADEFLIYPDWDARNLRELTSHLDSRGVPGIGALMLDLYPKGPLDTAEAASDAPVTERLQWFDAGPYRSQIVPPKRNRWVQGGVRERLFFQNDPECAPTLNKLPLIRWNWRHAYVNSTHSMLPPDMNDLYDGPGDLRLSGVLLHAKFLPRIVSRSTEELSRRQHFNDPETYRAYHEQLTLAPILWYQHSHRYEGWQQLVKLGLMEGGDWAAEKTELQNR